MKRVFIISLLVVFLLAACDQIAIGTRGSGKVITEERVVSGFDKVHLSGSGEVTIIQGDSESLVIEVEDNILPLLESEVVAGTLNLGPKENKLVNATKPIKYTITMREVNGISSTGSGKINAAEIDAGVLGIELSGSGEVIITSLDANTINLDQTGSGNVGIGGQVTDQIINITGSGDYDAADLDSRIADVQISGSGQTVLRVEDVLDIEITGSGQVSYYGDPLVSSEITGSGKLEQLTD
ncbi:MAG TPA: head GIN domain-containing protein [Patescibacteria group bacterium]|nr:head GIN domain-containing protein [Patescibacteria group bacterium]